MTNQEQLNADMQRQLALQDAKFSAFVDEMREFKNDMKAAQAKHEEDMKEIRERQEAAQLKHEEDMKAAQAKHNADMKEIRTENQGVLKQIQNLVLASMGLIIASVVGIMAIAVGVLGILWTTARSMQPPPPPSQSVYQLPPNTPPE